MTCRHIYCQTEYSLLRSFTGMLEVDIRSSHPDLPSLPIRLSRVYSLTRILVMDERAFVDVFLPRDFPLLRELTVSFTGVLFLTTNSPDDLDVAILDQLHLKLKYGVLDRDTPENRFQGHLAGCGQTVEHCGH